MKLSHVATLILFIKMKSKKNWIERKKLVRGVSYWLSYKITCNLNVDIILSLTSSHVKKSKVNFKWINVSERKSQSYRKKTHENDIHNNNDNNNLLTLPIIIGLYIRICYYFKLQRSSTDINIRWNGNKMCQESSGKDWLATEKIQNGQQQQQNAKKKIKWNKIM